MIDRQRCFSFPLVLVIFTSIGSLAFGQATFRGDAARSGAYDASLNARRLALRWRYQTQGPVRSSPAVSGSLVVFGSDDGSLHAVSITTGALAWTFEAGGAISSSPAIAGDTVYVVSADASVFAVDLETGVLRWRVGLGEPLPCKWGYDYWLSSPIVTRVGLVLGSSDGRVLCLDVETGASRWSHDAGTRLVSSPAVRDDTIFIGGMDGRLRALALESGEERWTFETEGASIDLEDAGYDRRSIVSSPSVHGSHVTFGSRDGKQYCVDSASGELHWKVGHPVSSMPGAPQVSWVEGSPATTAEATYIGTSDGAFACARALESGDELWRFDAGSRVNASPSVAGDHLLLGTGAGWVHVLDRATGNERWRFRTGDAVHSSPVVASGIVLVGSDDGSLYAFSDLDSEGQPLPERAVYFEKGPGSSWFRGAGDLATVFEERGFRVVGSIDLARRLEDWVERAEKATLVCASDMLPADVLDDRRLLRRFLEGGGRVIWVGVAPLALELDGNGGVRRTAAATSREVLEFDSSTLSPIAGEERRSVVTEAGRRMGLPDWTLASFPVDRQDVDVVLTENSSGQATAWVKQIGGRGGAFIRVWGRERRMADTAWIVRIAEAR
ncbi:MAG: PQQ-binding-like beta-propeller repeat protein [Planctomycetota bacterium]